MLVLSLSGKPSRKVGLHEAENSLIYKLAIYPSSLSLTKERDNYEIAMFAKIQVAVSK
jgi:hypothetical protein